PGAVHPHQGRGPALRRGALPGHAVSAEARCRRGDDGSRRRPVLRLPAPHHEHRRRRGEGMTGTPALPSPTPYLRTDGLTHLMTDQTPGPGTPDEPAAGLQPFLHDACVTLHAPSFTVSRPDGALRCGADGFYHGDRRALSRLEVSAGDVPLAWVGGGTEGADRASFRTVLRGVAESTPDPAVVLTRTRTTGPARLTETLR